MAVSTQNDKTPQAVQPASNPLVDHLGSRQCWLVGSGRPKDPSKPNGDPSKAPCDQNGYPVKAWHTRTDLLSTHDQATRKLQPPAVRFIGVRSSAAQDVAFYDLDDVLNAGGGCIDPVAWYLWQRWPTFTYVTPSGAGLRMVWIVEGDAQPVSIKTAVDRATGLSEVAFSAGVFDGNTYTVQPQVFNIGRELYYRADRFLIVTDEPYAWLVDGKSDPLRTITAGDLAEIAATVKMKRPPHVIEAENADATAGAVQIGATMTTTKDDSIFRPFGVQAMPAQIIEAQPVAQAQPMRVQVAATGAQAYAAAAVANEAAAVASTKEGGRNNELNKAAYKLGGLVGAGVLPEATAAAALESAARSAGLSDREAQATINSGIAAGAAKPRAIPERPAAQVVQGRAGVNLQSMRDRINTRRAVKVEGVQE